jgi:hypothetical protein
MNASARMRPAVLAGAQRADRPLDVHGVRQRDVDRLDAVVGEQRVVAAVGALDAVLAGVRVRRCLRAARHRDDLDLVREARAGQQPVVDAGGREDAEAHRRSIQDRRRGRNASVSPRARSRPRPWSSHRRAGRPAGGDRSAPAPR